MARQHVTMGLATLAVLLGCAAAASVFSSPEELMAAAGIAPKAVEHFFASPDRVVRRVNAPKRCFDTTEGQGAAVCRALGTSESPRVDPFLMLDFFHVQRPGGFPLHPHRGFETVTYMVDGSFHHEDSMGNAGTINTGDVQWMTAGSGVIHSEMPASDGVNHGLQLWVNLPQAHKMTEPKYQEIKAGQIPQVELFTEQGEAVTRVIAGNFLNATGPATSHTPILLLHLTLKENTHAHVPVPRSMHGFVFVFQGSCKLGGDSPLTAIQRRELMEQGKRIKSNRGMEASKGDIATMRQSAPTKVHLAGDTDDLVVTTKDDTVDVFIAMGVPIDEPVAQRGPFVMTTQEELNQAFKDFRSGNLVQKPNDHGGDL